MLIEKKSSWNVFSKVDARQIGFLLADFFISYIVWIVFFFLRKKVLDEGSVHQQEYLKLCAGSAVIAFFWTLVYYLFGFYHEIYRKSRIKEFFNLVNACFWGSILVFFAALLDDLGVNEYHKYYRTLFLYFSLQLIGASVVKFLTITRIKHLLKSKKVHFNCLLIGRSEKVLDSIKELGKDNHNLGLKFIGYVSPFEASQIQKNELRYWGDTNNDILKVIRRCNVERVVICIDPTEHFKIKEITNLLAGLGTKVSILPDLYQILIGSVKVEHVLGVPIIDLDHDLMPFWQVVIKRWMDVFVSFTVMVLCFPFFILIMLVTKGSSKGPVFFVQERVGLNRMPFKIIKFRSMYTNAELKGPALATDNDPRVTPWGLFMRKTRIDELPQFWNVFKGDMSLVGPRPERQFFIDQITQYAPEYRHLHKIRPGITSLGQVKYGYAENIEQMLERLKYDLLYIENMSIANDFRILYFTILTVIGGKGK